MSPQPYHPPSKSITTTDPFIVSIVLPFLECHILRIIQHIAFSDWLLSGNNKHLRFLHVFSYLLSRWLFIPLPTEDLPGGSDGKASACNVGDPSSIPGSGRSPGEGNGNPLHYSCLENPIDRGAWQATVQHGVAKSQTWLSH